MSIINISGMDLLFIRKVYKKVFTAMIVLAFVFGLASCGEGTVDLTEAKYDPKIVIDAYIYPGQKVEDIRITRNFPLEKEISVSDIILNDADVSITDLGNMKTYQLSYNNQKQSFEYNGNDWEIEFSKSYQINVKAIVDGKQLSATSQTTTPSGQFSLTEKNLGELSYRYSDNSGTVQRVQIGLIPAPGVEFYVFSTEALDARLDNFIYDNPFFEVDSEDVRKDFDRYRQEFTWLQNVNSSVNKLTTMIEWHSIWFYGNYRVIVYGGDKNFKDYLITHGDVQEMDGNFHEPAFHIKGDGIGVFASAVKDTLYFRIRK